MLELALDPAALPALIALPGLRRTGRSHALTLEFHDTPDGALLVAGRALCRAGPDWRLTEAGDGWAAPQVRAEARTMAALAPHLPEGLGLRAVWTGTRHAFRWTGEPGDAALVVLDGRFDRGAAPACRLSLSGDWEGVAALADLLAAQGATVPRTTLAQQALQAQPTPAPTREPEAGARAADSLPPLIAQQLHRLLHGAALIPRTDAPEAAHQMRVATRRLRAILSTFRHAAPTPVLDALSASLKDCAARLGAARDWDVFLEGAGARLQAAFPEDRRVASMLRGAAARRRARYRALRSYLVGPEFHRLAVALAHAAVARPWGEGTGITLQDFAARRLAARFRTVRRGGKGIAGLPVPQLHALRKDCKRLRYTAEFFAALFPGKPAKRFLSRLADLQEELGLLNDAAAIAGLMAQLGSRDRGYAAGLAEGFTAASSGAARYRIVRAWKRFRTADPFWPAAVAERIERLHPDLAAG